ncbi:MAG TPA: ATP-binding cassette domain-containing protein [Phycisphaerales bacterium]|nr:ATP-binding cassette domain-containing protein [Phycisphaerales bacterium]
MTVVALRWRSVARAVMRPLGDVFGGVRRALRLRPSIEPQSEPADCGFLCMSALLALHGRPSSVDQIKARVGGTSRGLTLKQLRDALNLCGLNADAVFFDKKQTGAFPQPGVVLLDRGHYVVVASSHGERLEVFDPEYGWSWIERRKLARAANGFGVLVNSVQQDAPALAPVAAPGGKQGVLDLLKLYLRGVGVTAIVAFAIAQAVALSLPLLTMQSVDAMGLGEGLGTAGLIGLGFVLVSLISAACAHVANLAAHAASSRATQGFAGRVFAALSRKPADWFERNPTSTLQNKVSSVDVQVRFAADVFRAIGGLAIVIILGAAALFFVSPWLALPGFLSLVLSVAIELTINRAQLVHTGAMIEASQKRQAFVLDVLAQVPLLARAGSLRAGQRRYRGVVRRAAVADLRLQGVQSWRTLLLGAVKSSETLLFVSLAALFMSEGGYTLGAFVALGAYKDLLAEAMGAMFQLRQRHKAMEYNRHQTRDLDLAGPLDVRPGRTLSRGRLQVNEVSFRYGALDPPLLNDVTFEVPCGECLVIRGPSGAGKSTLSKLIAGTLRPTAGVVLIDGEPPAHPMRRFGAVLQSDRLIAGTIRENLTLYRPGVRDSDIYRALKLAEAEEFVLGLPMRLNTFVAEGVSGLSGGQRQRLLIARAVLGDPVFLLLDEATSSLEVELEERILANLKATGATMVIVAHRPEVWAFADLIGTVRAGRLDAVERVEQGGIAEILAAGTKVRRPRSPERA